MPHYLAVLAVFRNEASFMSAWLEHYFMRGVEHIYLLDDGSTDDFYTPTFNKYLNAGQITLRHVAPEDYDNKKMERQRYLYNKYFGDVVSQTFWLGILDLDEFYYSPVEKSLATLLSQYETSSYQEILADWYWFGSAGYIQQPTDTVGSFLYRSAGLSRTYNYHAEGYHHEWCCKSFSKTKTIAQLSHHFNYYRRHRTANFCTQGKAGNEDFSFNLSRHGLGFINHYIGARDYYATKKTRGSCNNSAIVRDETLYDKLNKNDIFDPRLAEQTNARPFTDSRDPKHVVSL